jgi:hypothetical protein
MGGGGKTRVSRARLSIPEPTRMSISPMTNTTVIARCVTNAGIPSVMNPKPMITKSCPDALGGGNPPWGATMWDVPSGMLAGGTSVRTSSTSRSRRAPRRESEQWLPLPVWLRRRRIRGPGTAANDREDHGRKGTLRFLLGAPHSAGIGSVDPFWS